MKINRFLFAVALIFSITFIAHSQSWSPVANGVNGDVYALGANNNSLYIGGNFTDLMGLTDTIVSPMFAKFDGTNFDNTSLHFWDGGGITTLFNYNNNFFIAGDFTCPGNVSNILVYVKKQIVKPTYTLNSTVEALVNYNGTLIAGGAFHDTGSAAVNYIAQWNSTTNKWEAFGADTNTNGNVNALAVFNGSLYAAGDFTVIGGVIANYIARWDGTAWQPVGLGLLGSVNALKVYNNMLYVGGQFVLQGVDSVNHIAALDVSYNWHNVGNGIGATDPYADVRCFEVHGNELYIGGYFSIANGDIGNSIARWNGTTFDPVGNGITSPGAIVYSLFSWNGSLYVGGSFSEADSIPANNICKYDTVVAGIKEINSEISTQVYPNPSSSVVNFDIRFKNGSNTTGTIQITDIAGRNIIEQTFTTGLNSISVSSLAKGMYLYKVSSGTATTQGKFIVN